MRAAVALLAGVLALAASATPAAEPALAVIVHRSRTETISREEVARIYLGRHRFWNDGSAIVALNLPAGVPARERFSSLVLHEDSAHLAAYWNEQYFHGILPPPVLSSTDAVKRYVASNPRAIGYIEASQLDDTVRSIAKLE